MSRAGLRMHAPHLHKFCSAEVSERWPKLCPCSPRPTGGEVSLTELCACQKLGLVSTASEDCHPCALSEILCASDLQARKPLS